MASKKVEVQGIQIRIETINDKEFISLTDIIKKAVEEPKETVRNWIKNANTIRFLWAWEEIHNPDFKGVHLHSFIGKVADNRYNLSPTRWIAETGAVGLLVKRGRYGSGTFAHKDIALEFCSWFDPYFKVYLMKAFQELMEKEYKHQELEWHVEKITNNIDEVRNLLDTIPGQKKVLNRIANSKKGK